MASSTLGHISDLHFGLSQTHERTAAALCDALMAARVDHVVVSGDITHRGRADALERFEGMFHPLLRTGRMTVIPGNHDRLGHDVRRRISGDARVWLRQTDGLCIVCVDSTGPHNRGWLASYGQVTLDEVAEIEAMLAQAPAGVLKVVTLHHHPLPLPE
ncbi:MAG: metallophosphoesterase, partial [Myxococcales bacterium]|nr:metallophosphoesterase [Myxococcales bacterium]